MVLKRNSLFSEKGRAKRQETKWPRHKCAARRQLLQSMRLCSLGNSGIATEHAFSVTATEHGSRLIPARSLHGQEALTHLANQFCEKQSITRTAH